MLATIKAKVVAASCAVLAACAGTGAAGLWVTTALTETLHRSADAARLLRSHMQADMMHDALRGDVLSLLHSDDAGMAIPLEEARKDMAEHQESFRGAIQESRRLAAHPEVRQALADLNGPLDEYIAAASRIAEVQAHDPARAKAAYAELMARFKALEGAMSKASDAIEATTAAGPSHTDPSGDPQDGGASRRGLKASTCRVDSQLSIRFVGSTDAGAFALSDELKTLVAEVAAAYFAKNRVPPSEIRTVISGIATSLGSVGASPPSIVIPEDNTPKLTSAQIRKSISRDALISFEDNKPYKTLRRHLAAKGLTPEQYREKWALPADYPMAAPSYSEARAQMARSIGLGGRISAGANPPSAAEAAPLPAAASEPVNVASGEPIQVTEAKVSSTAMRSGLEPAGQSTASPTASVGKLTSAQIERSITPEALTSFEDGKPYKQLKRHLTARGMTPDEYRAKWGLPSDYPMVAANLSAARSAVAISSGFGKKAAVVDAPPVVAAPAPAASSVEPAHEPVQAATIEVSKAGWPFGEPAATTKPARARIPGRLSLFRKRPESA